MKTPCREDGGACFTKDGSISKVEKKEDKEEEKKKRRKNKRRWRRGEGGAREKKKLAKGMKGDRRSPTIKEVVRGAKRRRYYRDSSYLYRRSQSPRSRTNRVQGLRPRVFFRVTCRKIPSRTENTKTTRSHAR